MKGVKNIAAMVMSLGFSTAAHAWDADYTGKIAMLDVYDGVPKIMAFLEGGMPLCKSGYAYVSVTQATYQTMASVLLAAKAADRSVRIYANKIRMVIVK